MKVSLCNHRGNAKFKRADVFGSVLNESVGSKNLHKVRRYISSRYPNENPQKIVDAIRHDIPNVRLPKVGNNDTYKFMLGVTRMYLDGELSIGMDIIDLNKTLKYVSTDAHINEYDENLNGLSLNELVNRFKTVATQDIEAEKERLSQIRYNKSDYKIVPIDNAEEAAKYGEYTKWCVTYDESSYEQYTGGGFGRFYFCLKNGFQNVSEVKGENCPLDEYGLSMIAVSVNYDGSPNTITCRWNHDNGGNDNVMTPEQVSRLVGGSFYDLFKPYTKEELKAKGFIPFDEVQGMLDSGVKPENIFREVGHFQEGIAMVGLNGKWNYINKKGKIISQQWFDDACAFLEGFARVRLKNKGWNCINQEGKIISQQWFDAIKDFQEGFVRVGLNDKGWNYINKKGKLLSQQWFDITCSFREGLAAIRLNGKRWNYINKKGKIISQQWFDDAWDFSDGFGKVVLNGKCNYINSDGKLISDMWFDDVLGFCDGFCLVRLNGKYYYLNTKGQLCNYYTKEVLPNQQVN